MSRGVSSQTGSVRTFRYPAIQFLRLIYNNFKFVSKITDDEGVDDQSAIFHLDKE